MSLATAAPAGAAPADCSAGSTGSSGTCTLYTPNGTFNAGGSVSYAYDASSQQLTITVSGTGSITAGPWLCLGAADMSGSLLLPANQCTPNGPLATGSGQSLVNPVSSSGDTFVFDVPSGDFWFMHLGADGNTLEAAASAAVSAPPSNPGSNNPGSTNTGSNNTGSNNSSSNNSGSNTPGGTNTGSTNSSSNNSGGSDPGSTGPTDPGSSQAATGSLPQGNSGPSNSLVSDPSTSSPPASNALAGVTTAHTGEPFAGSKPYEVAMAALGILLLGMGGIMRRRVRARGAEVAAH